MKQEAGDPDSTFDLSAFDVVIINFVEESGKSGLFKRLTGLYGEQVPIDAGFKFAGVTRFSPPTLQFGGSIKFYSGMYLKKPLPDKFSALDISVVNRVTGWYEVISRARLNGSYLLSARQQFQEELVNRQTIGVPRVFEESHQALETYLSPYIGDNITIGDKAFNQKYFPCIYLGVVGNPKSNKMNDVLDETDHARSAIGFGIGIASILRGMHLLQQTGGTLHAGENIYQIMKFSVLQLFHVQDGNPPSSWSAETRTKFARVSQDYEIIDFISLMFLSYVVPTYRLGQIKAMQSENALLSREIREYSSTIGVGEPKDTQGKLIRIHQDIAKLKSAFLGGIVDLRNEILTQNNLLNSFSDYLSWNDSDNKPIEQAFVHPTAFREKVLSNYARNDDPITGALSNFLQESKSKTQELASTMRKVEYEQDAFMSYIADSINISLQNRLRMLTQNLATYTKWLIILTIILIVLAAVTLFITFRSLP